LTASLSGNAEPQAKGGTNIHGELYFLYLINQIILPTFDSASATEGFFNS